MTLRAELAVGAVAVDDDRLLSVFASLGLESWLAGLPDGKTLLSVAGNGTNATVVTLWDLATGKARLAPLRHKGNVNEVFFSAGGSLVMTSATDGFARIWDPATSVARWRSSATR